MRHYEHVKWRDKTGLLLKDEYALEGSMARIENVRLASVVFRF